MIRSTCPATTRSLSPIPRGHLAELAAEREAFGDRVGAMMAAARPSSAYASAAGLPVAAGELDRLAAQPVAALTRRLVTQRSLRGGREAWPGARRPRRRARRALPRAAARAGRRPGPRPDDPPAVAGCRARKLKREADAPSDAGGVEEALLRDRTVSRPNLRLAEREEKLAARVLVARVRQVERVERRLVQARGLLVGEERQRTVAGALGVAEGLVEVASGDGVVRELGQVLPGSSP